MTFTFFEDVESEVGPIVEDATPFVAKDLARLMQIFALRIKTLLKKISNLQALTCNKVGVTIIDILTKIVTKSLDCTIHVF